MPLAGGAELEREVVRRPGCKRGRAAAIAGRLQARLGTARNSGEGYGPRGGSKVRRVVVKHRKHHRVFMHARNVKAERKSGHGAERSEVDS